MVRKYTKRRRSKNMKYSKKGGVKTPKKPSSDKKYANTSLVVKKRIIRSPLVPTNPPTKPLSQTDPALFFQELESQLHDLNTKAMEEMMNATTIGDNKKPSLSQSTSRSQNNLANFEQQLTHNIGRPRLGSRNVSISSLTSKDSLDP